MTQPIYKLFLVALVAAAVQCGDVRADDPRETPLVRAVKRVKSAVVNIHSEKTTYDDGSVFAPRKGRKVNGMGTGIIIDPRGYIVTNHHVVSGVDVLTATLEDASTFDATTVSVDAEHDLAIIKIESKTPLPVMPMGTSSDIMLGETVIAVGNAFGYEHTVTAGIVSQLHRDVEVNETQSYRNLIQTDASINPGNSGGPLLNLAGEVVGINVAIRAGAQRIGFAIPIDDARMVIRDLMSTERLEGTMHGLLAKDYKRGGDRKLIVTRPEPGSPAAKAGFKKGDIVKRAGEVTVVDGVDFERALIGRDDVEPIEILVERDGKDERLKLALRRRSYAGQLATAVVEKTAADKDGRSWSVLGLKLASVDPEVVTGTRYRGGLKVAEVRAGSPAAKNGIRPGDVLVGLHVWETINAENVSYVLTHPRITNFNPLKFYIVRGRETLYGHLKLNRGEDKVASAN
ncbi:trypsin-like peptidase domain-containing protein [Stratiformator vulcanicus]|uniref:Serine protease HhoB n=1 Tax=Stratiformator vulcanicus TaxID=2527980 RepID=A0A517QWC8_9PLAN|nr:trypsin-like peptidase domain-containing protein [Stratiformator vulcanicus]QDT35941.1 Putative serine protease HhoB precursor [Stratiformator vulcanicus]